jgi:hypothetical protein
MGVLLCESITPKVMMVRNDEVVTADDEYALLVKTTIELDIELVTTEAVILVAAITDAVNAAAILT